MGSPRRVEQCVLFETLLVAELVARARDARHEAATLEYAAQLTVQLTAGQAGEDAALHARAMATNSEHGQ